MRRLGLMAKHWQPGRVKTRLAKAIGLEEAAELHRAMLSTLLARCAQLADERVLAYFPAEKRADFACLAGPAWRLAPQGVGDLGARMHRWFDEAFAAGATRAVLIGADSPTIPLDRIDDAFQQLETHPAVLGPAVDGGYYLIGLARMIPELFVDLAWGTGQVCAESVAILQRAGIPSAMLPAWYDVDRREDLVRLRGELFDAPAPEGTYDALRACLGRIAP